MLWRFKCPYRTNKRAAQTAGTVTVVIMIAMMTIGDIVATMTGDIDMEHEVAAM